MPGSRLCLAEREEIRAGLERGDSMRDIARELGRAGSTVSREVARNGSRWGYRAAVAQHRADRCARRPKVAKLVADGGLADSVKDYLKKKLSPIDICKRLKGEGQRISHETIYRACYQPNGPLGDDAYRLLPRRRRGRKRNRRTRSGRIPKPLGDIRLVQLRQAHLPQEQGHWEGDLLVGQQNRTVAAVLTERHSRYTLLGALPEGRNADHVADVVTQLLGAVPHQLRRTLTWDQGRELTRWASIEQRLGLEVFFCEPRSPWQKPLVENVCGLLRRWLPRNQPIPTNQAQLDQIVHLLNTMHRRILNWDTAANTYHQLTVATTT